MGDQMRPLPGPKYFVSHSLILLCFWKGVRPTLRFDDDGMGFVVVAEEQEYYIYELLKERVLLDGQRLFTKAESDDSQNQYLPEVKPSQIDYPQLVMDAKSVAVPVYTLSYFLVGLSCWWAMLYLSPLFTKIGEYEPAWFVHDQWNWLAATFSKLFPSRLGFCKAVDRISPLSTSWMRCAPAL